jgi:hypothetical protein
MTSAAFKALPGNSSSRSTNDDVTSVRLPHPTFAVSTSHKQLEAFWHLPALLNGSICTPLAAAADSMGALCHDWLHLPADSCSTGSDSSSGSPRAHPSIVTSATDTIVDVLLLLGGSSSSAPAYDCGIASTDEVSCEALAGLVVPSGSTSSGAGCPPNAPLRRPPPVMLLPAEELPGLMLMAA